MRPWQHAKSGVKSGSTWQNDLEIHEFLDSTKAACADRRHRFVLHHTDLGTTITQAAFPDRENIYSIVKQHVKEDLGQAVCLQDWFDCADWKQLPKVLSRRMHLTIDDVAQMITNSLNPDAFFEVRQVTEFLCQASDYCSVPREIVFAPLMHSASLGLVHKVFGPPTEKNGKHGKFIIDYSYIAEAVIFTFYGRIPDLGEVARCIKHEPAISSVSGIK